MYAGRIVERAPTQVLFKKMHMPYTEALLVAIPKMDAAPHTPLPANFRPAARSDVVPSLRIRGCILSTGTHGPPKEFLRDRCDTRGAQFSLTSYDPSQGHAGDPTDRRRVRRLDACAMG